MKVTILTPNTAENCLGRAYILAEALSEKYDVEIVGPYFEKNKIWPPLKNQKKIKIIPIRIRKGVFSPYLDIIELYKACRGDILYSSKTYITTVGIALVKKVLKNRIFIADIDDWEVGFAKDKISTTPVYKKPLIAFKSMIRFFYSDSLFSIFVSSYLVRWASNITVSNNYLKAIYGGVLIPHFRDESFLNPKEYNKAACRDKYFIPKSKKVVMFYGTPRPHKGLENLVESVHLLKHKNVVLVIAGLNKQDKYSRKIEIYAKKLLGNKFYPIYQAPFKELPEIIQCCDIYVVPQEKSNSTIGQFPAKIYDALAMDKTVISTNVGDIKNTLDGCGIVIPNNSVKNIKSALRGVFSGKYQHTIKPRERFLNRYSKKVNKTRLMNIFSDCNLEV